MKRRLFPVLLLLTVILAASGGAYWWFFLHKTSEPPACAFLPEDTLFYAEIPDGLNTYARYEQSHLKDFLESPEIAPLFALSTASLPKSDITEKASHYLESFEKLSGSFVQAANGCSFVALTHLKIEAEGQPDIGIIAGFRPKLGTSSVKPFFENCRHFIQQELAEGKELETTTASHADISYQWTQINAKTPKLCHAEIGSWHITTLGENTLHSFIDAWQAGGTGPSLFTSPEFSNLQNHLPTPSDAIGYINIQQCLSTLKNIPFLQKQKGADLTFDFLLDQYKAYHASIFTLRFNGKDLEEEWILHFPASERPDLGASYQPCAYNTLRFTSPDTLTYFGGSLDLPKNFSYLTKTQDEFLKSTSTNKNNSTIMPQTNIFPLLRDQFAMQGLNFDKNILEAVGNEFGFALDWPQSSPFPEALIALSLKNQEDFRPTYDKIVENLIPLCLQFGHTERDKFGAFDLLHINVTQAPMLSPTLFIGENYFGLTLTAAGAKRLLASTVETGLASTPAFINETAPYRNQTSNFFYSQLPPLFDRSYSSVKPLLPILAASLQVPNAAAAQNLPQELAFSKHLGTFLYSTSVEGDYATAKIKSGTGNPLFVPLLSILALEFSTGTFDKDQQDKAEPPASSSPAAPESSE